MLQHAVDKSTRERENMQQEMDMLLDRINKMSDMLDKSRVSFPSGLDFQTKLEDCSYFVVHFPKQIFDFLPHFNVVALLYISRGRWRKTPNSLSLYQKPKKTAIVYRGWPFLSQPDSRLKCKSCGKVAKCWKVSISFLTVNILNGGSRYRDDTAEVISTAARANGSFFIVRPILDAWVIARIKDQETILQILDQVQ